MLKDLLIIGCGPTGLYAWKQAADFGLSGIVVEGTRSYGGQVKSSYPEKTIKNLPAILEIKAGEAMDNMYAAVNKTADFEVKFNTKILDITPFQPSETEGVFENYFKVIFSDQSTCEFKSILFADGIGFYTPIRLSEEDYNNVAYTITDLKKYAKKDVIVFGGGDAALDWANEIAKIAKSVKIIHRRQEFRANEASLSLAKSLKVELLTPFSLTKILEVKKGIVKKLEIGSETEKKTLTCDEIVVQFGQQISKSKFENLDLEFVNNGRLLVDQSFQTNISGIFAAGDCCSYPTKVRNILACVFESMHAIINIEKVLKKRKIVNNGW